MNEAKEKANELGNKFYQGSVFDAERFGGTKVCLIPVRSNTKWWAEVCVKAEIRFINGEVNFNDEERGRVQVVSVFDAVS